MPKITDSDKSKQAMQLLEANSNFKKAVSAFQERWHISESDPNREKRMGKLPMAVMVYLKDKTKHRPLHRYIKKGTPIYRDVLKVLGQFKLSKRYWFDTISYYLLYGKFNPNFTSLELGETMPDVTVKIDPVSGEYIATIELGKNTTLEDIKGAYLGAREMLSYYNDNSLKQRFGYKKNFNRDSDIFNLYLNGKSISEISSEINLKYKEDLDYGNIKKIVSQMKKIRAMGGGKLLTSKTKIGRRNRGLADLF